MLLAELVPRIVHVFAREVSDELQSGAAISAKYPYPANGPQQSGPFAGYHYFDEIM
jgi:hypothetical protein